MSKKVFSMIIFSIFTFSSAAMDRSARIYIAGHTGLVGLALVRRLKKEGFENIITRTCGELDLKNQEAVNKFIEIESPDFVF